MMTADQTSGAILCLRPGRAVVVARAGELERYQALRVYGVKASVACAVAVGLVTIKLKG